jgi:hypothetical protein
MKLRKNKRMSKKRMRGGVGEEVNTDAENLLRKERDAMWDEEYMMYKCWGIRENDYESYEDFKNSEEYQKCREQKKTEKDDLTRKFRNKLIDARVKNNKPLEVPTDEESEFIEAAFIQMFPEGSNSITRFILFMNKLIEREVFKKFMKTNRSKLDKIYYGKGIPHTACYNHIQSIIINFNNKIPSEEKEKLNFIDPDNYLSGKNNFSSIFGFEFIASAVNKFLALLHYKTVFNEENFSKKFNEWTLFTYYGKYGNVNNIIVTLPGAPKYTEYLILNTTDAKSFERFKQEVHKNKYILFQIALELINILFLSDTDSMFSNKEGRINCNDIDNKENRFNITLNKILSAMNPGSVAGEAGVVGEEEEEGEKAGEAGVEEEVVVGKEDEEAGGGRRRTRKRKRTIKQKKSKKKTYKYRKLRKLRRK